MTKATLKQPQLAPAANQGQIRPETSCSLPKPVLAEVADAGRVRFGAGYRLPADRSRA